MGELDDRVTEAIAVAFKLTLVTGVCAVSMYMGYTNLAGTGIFEQRRNEKMLLYESEDAWQFANNALRKFGCLQDELYGIDRDKNGTITEKEVMNYFRSR